MGTLIDYERKIEELEKEIASKKEQLAALRQSMPKQVVSNYTFKDQNGTSVQLSQLFGDHKELMIVHNMGRSCSYCTLWADGFNGVIQHLENKVPFVVSTPDSPEVQRAIAEERNWRFKMVSTEGTTFKRDFGFEFEDGSFFPGVSVFVKDEEDNIIHHAKAAFGPGDDFCSVWHLFDLLPSGSKSWHPKKKYD